MRRVMVRYRVKSGQAEQNAALVRDVYAELAQTRPEGLRYVTYKLEDGVSFVHIASVDGPNPLPGLAAFQRFLEGIAERCEEPPVTVEIEEVGSFSG
jgi:hypothetical protein